MMDRWIVEEKKGGFFFLDRLRHRAIFPSLCAAGILRDKSDKSIRHAELTYDPRCRVCVHVANLLPLRPDPWERATFLPQYVRPRPRIPLFSLSLWTEPQVSLSLSLSQIWLLHGQIFLNSVETLWWRSREQISPAKGRWITIPREYPLTPAS